MYKIPMYMFNFQSPQHILYLRTFLYTKETDDQPTWTNSDMKQLTPFLKGSSI
jgi:hypothetical protein